MVFRRRVPLAAEFHALQSVWKRESLTADGLSWNEMSDPVVAIDSSRKIVYLSDLYFSDFDWSNGYYISSSSFKNGSVSFTAANTRPVAVNTDPNSQTFEDKPWIAVDNTRNPATSGNLYAAWVHYLAQQYFPAGGEIHVVRSSDHGATFSTATVVSPTWQVNNVQAPQIAVDAHGRVIVSWLYCLDYEPVPGQFNDKCMQSQIWELYRPMPEPPSPLPSRFHQQLTTSTAVDSPRYIGNGAPRPWPSTQTAARLPSFMQTR